MFAHVLLLITLIFAIGSIIYQSLPYRSLVKDDILFAYDYIIGTYINDIISYLDFALIRV